MPNNYGRIIKTQGNAFRILLVCVICVTLSHELPVLRRLRKRVSNSSEWITNLVLDLYKLGEEESSLFTFRKLEN